MTSSRTWVLATILIAAAFVHPAQAATPASTADASTTAAVTHSGHHGEAFAAKNGAKAIIVEPDGRVIATDGRSDLVAPASIAERRTKAAIARLIDTAAHSGPVHDKLGSS
jgi:hypothetical protein